MADGRVPNDVFNLLRLQYGLTWGVFVLFVIIAIVSVIGLRLMNEKEED